MEETKIHTVAEIVPQQQVSPLTRGARTAYLVVAWLFIAAIFLQVFFAGASIFVGPTWWNTHVEFGHSAGMLTILLLLLAFVARFKGRQIGLTALLILLYTLQYLFIELPGRLGILLLSALHPVNALLMFWLTITLARRARSSLQQRPS